MRLLSPRSQFECRVFGALLVPPRLLIQILAVRTKCAVLFGTAGISFTAYALPSTISIIPWCGTTVYFGSLARDLAGIVDGRIPFQSGSASYIFYGVSGLMMVVGVTYMTIFSRCASSLPRLHVKASSHIEWAAPGSVRCFGLLRAGTGGVEH